MFRSPFCAVELFYMFPFSLFCIYFMPGEKYNLFSCPESGAKVHTRPGLVSQPWKTPSCCPFYTICQLHFTLCSLCCTPFVQLRLPPHTALHGMVILWKYSYLLQVYHVINKYDIMCNYICSSSRICSVTTLILFE